MKITNFKFVSQIDDSKDFGRMVAVVDVTTGFWWWKKTRKIAVESIVIFGTATHWKFFESRKFTPGIIVETLYKKYKQQLIDTNDKK